VNAEIRFVVPVLLAALSVQAGAVQGLPSEAKIVEVRPLPKTVAPNRALVLWMVKPQGFPRHLEQGDADTEPDEYTCPDETRGWFYRGPTRVSLVDTSTDAIINTVEIKVALVKGWQDDFDIPYRIRPTYYRVDPPLRAGEGTPVILDLRDYNGDGEALEFAVFDAQSCSVVQTQLIGYSRRQDRVIQYAIELSGDTDIGRDPTLLWLDKFLVQKPIRPGIWRYERHYNSGARAKFDISYDPVAERFRGTVQWERDW